jgi:hypothetical protein
MVIVKDRRDFEISIEKGPRNGLERASPRRTVDEKGIKKSESGRDI